MSDDYLEFDWRGERRRVDLVRTEACRIGRGELNTVVLTGDPTISLRHAIVQHFDPTGFYLTDLGSRNGTMLNGRAVTSPTLLVHGDVFVIGGCEFAFHEKSPGRMNRPFASDFAATQVLVSRKLITVLVADIRNYTALTLELGEARISELVASIFRRAGEVLSENGSWAQKYIGDAVMAVWIHKEVTPAVNEFERVFRSLVELEDIFAHVNRRYGLSRPIAFGAGVNTGYASIGNMGSTALPDHTALGDTVNKAFRLESTTKTLGVEVVIGRLTYDFLTVMPEIQAGLMCHMVELKGYPKAEEVYSIELLHIARALRQMKLSSA